MMSYNRIQDIMDGLQLHGKTVFTLNDAAMLMKKPGNMFPRYYLPTGRWKELKEDCIS